jgi:hypothetical protein
VTAPSICLHLPSGLLMSAISTTPLDCLVLGRTADSMVDRQASFHSLLGEFSRVVVSKRSASPLEHTQLLHVRQRLCWFESTVHRACTGVCAMRGGSSLAALLTFQVQGSSCHDYLSARRLPMPLHHDESASRAKLRMITESDQQTMGATPLVASRTVGITAAELRAWKGERCLDASPSTSK